MPIIKSAIKRMRQTNKRRERNVATKRTMRSAVKAFLAKPSAKGLRAAQSEIDTAVKKNILKKNTAARRKSNLVKAAKEAGVKVEKVAKSTTPTKPKTAVKKPATAKKTPAKAKKQPSGSR